MLRQMILGSGGVMSLGGFKSGTHNQLIFVLRALIIAPRACSHAYLHRKCPEERSCSMTHITMMTVQHTCCLSFSLWVDITYFGEELWLGGKRMNGLTPHPVLKTYYFQRKAWEHVESKLSRVAWSSRHFLSKWPSRTGYIHNNEY